jgi:hypothetical protein
MSQRFSSRANTIFVPSGDHAGNSSSLTVEVRAAWSEPSAFITQMSGLPARLLTKAIFELSGDQAGSESHAVFTVSLCMFAPVASTL